MFWPKIDGEYQQELQGIADGLNQHGVKLDIWDVVAMNGFAELPDYYVPWLNEQTKAVNAPDRPVSGHCSAFVATGSWTTDHRIVMGHNNWTTYVEGARWRIVFDLVPRSGYRLLMDGLPGIIASDDDFGVNSAGLMSHRNHHLAIPRLGPEWKTSEFVRSRKAMQYAGSIDDYVKIMADGNNGGYANDWLLGDRKSGEVARFELGLKHTKLWRTERRIFLPVPIFPATPTSPATTPPSTRTISPAHRTPAAFAGTIYSTETRARSIRSSRKCFSPITTTPTRKKPAPICARSAATANPPWRASRDGM